MPLLYEIPKDFLLDYDSGKLKLYGALLKDAVTGQIRAHVQPTSVLDMFLTSTLRGASATISQGFNPLGILTALQNEQIKSQLRNLNASLGILQNLQIGTLAVSGLGLGVSVAGFAVMLQKLKAIENHLKELGSRVDQVTVDRRSDELATVFADIGADLETIDTLSARKNGQQVAEAVQISLARSASRLGPYFTRTAAKQQDLTLEDLDLLWTLASALRLCADASFKALLHIEELEVAAAIAHKQAARFAELSDPLAPDRLARLCARSAPSFEEMIALRDKAIGPATLLTEALRTSATQAASNTSLAKLLAARGLSGRQYLEEAEQEKDRPLLLLAA
ncbi:hypothetical protein [Arenibacterium sp. LLYu02]|uniref:hypothetical protein n=1 Tax=Arenibacterium sp. LLYu02 TaxID=3404132 RepID=UPI003B212B23